MTSSKKQAPRIRGLVTLGILGIAFGGIVVLATAPPDPVDVSLRDEAARRLAGSAGHVQENERVLEALAAELERAPVAEAVGGAPGPQLNEDAEWALLPRAGESLALRPIAPGDLKAETMFRSTDLNPTDLYIPRADREALEIALVVRVRRFLAAREQLSRISSQEMEYLAAHNAVPSRLYSEFESGWSAEEQASARKSRDETRARLIQGGATVEQADRSVASMKSLPESFFQGQKHYAVQILGDRVHWASLAALPQTNQAAALCLTAGLDCYSAVLQFFEQRHAISPERAAELGRLVQGALSARYPVE